MQYGILDLGGEKLVARYVGSAEQFAYNESVFAARCSASTASGS